MIKDYISILYSILSRSTKVPALPRHIQIDLTTHCNLKCKMCLANEVLTENEQKQHLEFDNFKHVIDTVRPVSVNMATSGEPFLNPDVFKMIDYAHSCGVETIISTNFILPEAVIEKAARSSLDILKISIDGATKATYERIRGNHFDKLVENISLFNRIKGAGKNPAVRFNFVIMKDNYHEIADYMDFADKFGVRHVYFYALDTREYNESLMNELAKGIDMQKLKNNLKAASKKAASCGIKTNIGNLLSNFDILIENYAGKNEQRKFGGRCLLPWLGLYISVQGRTSPCCIMYPDEAKSLGNIFTGDINAIWNGEKSRNMRSNFISCKNYGIYEGCRHCIPMDLKNLLRASLTFPGFLKGLFK